MDNTALWNLNFTKLLLKTFGHWKPMIFSFSICDGKINLIPSNQRCVPMLKWRSVRAIAFQVANIIGLSRRAIFPDAFHCDKLRRRSKEFANPICSRTRSLPPLNHPLSPRTRSAAIYNAKKLALASSIIDIRSACVRLWLVPLFATRWYRAAAECIKWNRATICHQRAGNKWAKVALATGCATWYIYIGFRLLLLSRLKRCQRPPDAGRAHMHDEVAPGHFI